MIRSHREKWDGPVPRQPLDLRPYLELFAISDLSIAARTRDQVIGACVDRVRPGGEIG